MNFGDFLKREQINEANNFEKALLAKISDAVQGSIEYQYADDAKGYKQAIKDSKSVIKQIFKDLNEEIDTLLENSMNRYL